MRTKAVIMVIGLALVGAGQTVHTLDVQGIQPLSLLAADLNRDGFPDLAVACHSSNSVAIFENTRKPCASFDGPVHWKLWDSPVALAVGSFLDPICPLAPHCFPYTTLFPNVVVVTQYRPGLARFTPVEPKEPFLKIVSGGPVDMPALPFITLTDVVVADLNHDGATDVAVLDGVSMKIGFYFGVREALLPAVPAQGGAARPPDKQLDLHGEQAYSLGTADFDRDGYLDLAVTIDGDLVFIPYPYGERPFTKVKLGKKLVNFEVGDFNRDGYIDVAVVDPEFGALTVIFNRGCWQFERGPRLKFDGQPVALATADFDRNGLIDIAVVEKGAGRVSIVINELSSLEEIKRTDSCDHSVTMPEKIDRIELKVVRVFDVGDRPVAVTAEDFDLNGIPDLAVALFGENKVKVIFNPNLCRNCSGEILCPSVPITEEEPTKPSNSGEARLSGPSFAVSEGPVFSLSPHLDFDVFAAGDLDGDGKTDLILGSSKDNSLYLFQGENNGVSARGNVYIGLAPEKLLCADLDGNGLADVVAVSWRQAQGVVLWSKGSFLFSPVSFFGLPSEIKDIMVARLPASPKDDLLFLAETQPPTVWNIPQRGKVIVSSNLPPYLAGLKPTQPGLSSYIQLKPDTVAMARYSNNPGELSLTLGSRVLGSFQVSYEGEIIWISVADVNGDGCPDILGLEKGGKVRAWLIRKE